MARRKTSREWEGPILTLTQNTRLSSDAIARKLAEDYSNSDKSMGPPPKARTIREIQKRTPQADLESHSYFRWPESMGSAGLPWEASRVLLDLLRHCSSSKDERPTIRFAQLFWRITLAAPDLKIGERFDISGYLAQVLGQDDGPEKTKAMRGIEAFLGMAPWKSKVETAAYQIALRSKELPASGHQEWGEKRRLMLEVFRFLGDGGKLLGEAGVRDLSKKLGRPATERDVKQEQTRGLRKKGQYPLLEMGSPKPEGRKGKEKHGKKR